MRFKLQNIINNCVNKLNLSTVFYNHVSFTSYLFITKKKHYIVLYYQLTIIINIQLNLTSYYCFRLNYVIAFKMKNVEHFLHKNNLFYKIDDNFFFGF